MLQEALPSWIADDAVVEVTNAVCETLLGATPLICGVDGAEHERISAWVSIRGAWRGEVEVRLSHALAARLVREVLQVEALSSDDPNMSDVVGEVANIIGGNLKALLPEPCSLSLPRVTSAVRAAHPDHLHAFRLGEDAFEVAICGAGPEGDPS